ncbi:MAG: PHB depolymerase family esterase [Actinomycetota bacterium]
MHFLRGGATILVLLAVAGCAGPPPAGVSREQDPTPPSASPTTVLTSAVPGPAEVPPTTSSSSPRPSCGREREAGTVVLALPGGRRALLAVPAGDDGQHRLGLVIGLPGYGRTSEELAAQSRMPSRAMAADVLAVIPQGAGRARSWNFTGTTGRDDLAFLTALVTQLTASECADPTRVVITGISDGGDMAAFAACALPGRFRAVVTVAASFNPRPGCHPTRIVAVHGDADPIDPYRGGTDGRPGYPAIPPAASAIAAWAAVDGCRTPASAVVARHIVTTTYPCGAQLVTVRGGGHTWPGGAPVDSSLGPTTGEYDATATILGLL